MGTRKTGEEGAKRLQAMIEAAGGHAFEDSKELIAQAAGLWQFAPFEVGDRVVLMDAPEITQADSPGWMGYRHLVVNGAKAVVREVEWRHYAIDRPQFTLMVTFDADTESRPGHFCLGAYRFVKAAPADQAEVIY